MKLYTEEQVRRIAKLYRHELYLLEAAINTEKPIELPSDKDIRMQTQFATNDFYWGAQWLKNQILNQNK